MITAGPVDKSKKKVLSIFNPAVEFRTPCQYQICRHLWLKYRDMNRITAFFKIFISWLTQESYEKGDKFPFFSYESIIGCIV